MLHRRCFEKTWIDAKRAEQSIADPGLLEKCIHALHLLCLLADSGLDFVFKGGTSMLLLLSRVKQVVDVGTLFDQASDLTLIRATYGALFQAENSYRGSRFTIEEALNDTIDTARMICEIQLRGAPPDPRRELIVAGMGRMESHLVGAPFRLDDLKIAAARAACIAALIRNPSSPLTLDDLRYDAVRFAKLGNTEVTFSRPLNRLRQTNPEALFCWHLVSRAQAGGEAAVHVS